MTDLLVVVIRRARQTGTVPKSLERFLSEGPALRDDREAATELARRLIDPSDAMIQTVREPADRPPP